MGTRLFGQGLFVLLLKGGDPAAPSDTATLLRLHPSHEAHRGRRPPLRVRLTPSGEPHSHGVTGGVYKTRERIHRSNADLRLLAIPTSCRRVAADNPNWGRVSGICSTLRIRNPLSRTIVARV